MGFDFCPSKMKPVTASEYAPQLRIIRIVSLALLVFKFVFDILQGIFVLRSIGTACVVFSLLFEIFAVLASFVDSVNNVASVLFVIAWDINTTLVAVLIYLSTSLSLLDLLLYVPWIVLLVDFVFNQVAFIRLHYVFPLGILAFDLFFWFIEIQIIDVFLSATTTILYKLAILAIALGVLELSRLIKVRSCSESDHEKSLL